MAINIDTLFTRLGKLAKIPFTAHTYADGDLADFFDAAIAALGTEYDLLAPLPAAKESALQSASALGPDLQAAFANVVTATVNADTPLADEGSVELAVQELIRQMIAQADSVAECTVSASSAADASNVGDGVVVVTVLNLDGTNRQNVFAEIGELICTGDAQNQTASEGSEPWLYRGDFAAPDDLGHEWPGASGAQTGLTTLDSQTPGLNLLLNGGLDTFTVANTPDDWVILVGTAGTTFLSEATTVHRGAGSLELVGNGSVSHTFAQTFAAGVIRPNRLYAINLKLRVNSALTAGALFVAFLGDGSNTAIEDDQGNTHILTVASDAISDSDWTNLSGVFLTPRVLPATVKLILGMSAGMAGGKSVFVDSVTLGEMTELYPGGPHLAVFAGATPWMTNDRHLVTVANDRAGASYGATFQASFDRFLGMREMGLQLPYAGSETQADTKITA